MKILISAFTPFNQEKDNVSLMVLDKLPILDDIIIKKVIVDTIQNVCFKQLKEAYTTFKPDYIIMLGQSGSAKMITLERVALNLDDFRIKDNGLNQPIDQLIINNGPTAYFQTLPLKKIYHELTNNDLEACISNSAGTFVCNHLFYQCLHDLNNSKIKAGFIHLPKTNNLDIELTCLALIKTIQLLGKEQSQ
ncbi:MAG: pyroglutamyl-peptidase I [Bacilli bacterium]